MSRITRRKQEAPKRMKYGENGAKLEPLVAPSNDDSPNQETENESEDDNESGEEKESSPPSPNEDINVVDDGLDSVRPGTPDTPIKLEKSTTPPPSRDEDDLKWRPLNGVVKMETEIMDLSSKRRRSTSDESEPDVKIPRKVSERKEESQPLDLSQKSSRLMDEPRRPITPPPTTQPLPISPSLASLQKKFGGQVNPSKTPIDVARSKSPPNSSQSRMWYSNVYRQTMSPYSALYQPKMPYYPMHPDVPLHASYPALAAAAAGLMPDLSSLGNAKPPKATSSVTMTTKSQTSITQSPNKHKSLLPKSTQLNGNPHLSPITSPRGALTSTLNFDLKDVKTNCIDFKCDCGKTYSTLYELSVHMQDTGHMPRNTKAGPSGDYPKLVRGQDMWLNNGLEQTKQILRCMHCGESFKTLPELTVHMMKTQHYADIFSSAHRKMHKCTTFFEKENDTKSVFKCRVCETEYESLDSLANHMVESRHHKRSNSRSMDDPVKVRQSLLANMAGEDFDSRSEDTPPLVSPPVFTKPENHDRPRDLARDLARDQSDVVKESNVTKGDNDPNNMPSASSHNGDVNHNTDKDTTSPSTSVDVRPMNGRESPPSDEEEHNIKCENCFDRIKTDLFVEHVRHCISKDRKTVKPQVTTSVSKLPSPPPLQRVEPGKGGSALKAMEQFIENFNDRKPHKSQAPMSSLLYDYVGPIGSQKPVNGESKSPVDKMRPYDRPEHSALHNLYRFTSYGPQRLPSRVQEPRVSPLPSPKHSPRTSPLNDVIIKTNDVRNDVTSPPSKEERKSVSPRLATPTSPVKGRSERGSCSSPGDGGYHSNDVDSTHDDVNKKTPSEAIQNGRLSPLRPKRDTEPDSSNNSKTALDSLKGLVDKHMDKSEHPLNSLQKLINQTDGNHGNNVSSLQSRLINVTSSPYWFSFSHLTRGWQTKPDSPGSDRDDNRSVVDSDGVEVNVSDLKCDNCGKLFSSRGGCRYHRSKCLPQSQPNKVSGSKEAQIVQTPYTYMPLEHTNKFSKYYEMARELANKTT